MFLLMGTSTKGGHGGIVLLVLAIVLIICFVKAPGLIRTIKEKKKIKYYKASLSEKYDKFSISEKRAIYNDLIEYQKLEKQISSRSSARATDMDSIIKGMAGMMRYENFEDDFFKKYGVPLHSFYVEYDLQYLAVAINSSTK